MAEDLNRDSYPPREGSPPGSEGEPAPSTEKPGYFASLRIPNFRFLFSGSVFAYALQWVKGVILSWLVYDLTTSGTILGTINLVMSLASICMLLVVGTLVDYFNRRNILLIETGVMLVINLALGLAVVFGYANIGHLFVFAFIFGLVQMVDFTARQVMVFDLVPRYQAPGAMALSQTGWSLMRVLGPSLGGFLLIWAGAGGSFLFQAGVCVIIILITFPMKLPPRKAETVPSSPFYNFREGVGYLIKQPVTRVFTIIGIVLPVLIIPIFNVLPAIYAVEVFGDDSGQVLGFLMASVGAGGILGGIAITYLRRLEHWGRLEMASLFLLGLSLIGFALSSSLPTALVLLALAGFFELIFLTMNQTLIQLSIPDILRGRVTAAVNLTWVFSPIGSLLIGIGSDAVGPKMITIIFASVTALIVVLIMLASPTVRNYRLSQGIASPSGTPGL